MTATCQVDFYVLECESQSAERLACRLAVMAWEQGHRVSVLTESGEDTKAMDELMWEVPPGRFIPHGVGMEGATCPVSIGSMDEKIPGDRDVIINLATRPVTDPERFRRLLEIVPADAGQRTASRDKFRQYRELGLDPVSHTIGQS